MTKEFKQDDLVYVVNLPHAPSYRYKARVVGHHQDEIYIVQWLDKEKLPGYNWTHTTVNSYYLEHFPEN